MLVFIWASLILGVRGTVPEGKQQCQSDYCITLSDGPLISSTGLCIVIPCNFSTPLDFKPTSAVWYKCDPPKTTHVNSDTPIFDSSNADNAQPEFRGRVSLLESDLSRNNCSIIINDLKTSDSGSYQLRLVDSRSEKTAGFSYLSMAQVNITDLVQKPTLVNPFLTAGQQNTLTCTAPGLCSGSVPEFTWTWRKIGENNSYITGNITDTKTENVSDVTRRHSSTLTFNPSADHHNTEVTCKVNFRGNLSTEETETLNVNYVTRCTEDAKQNITSEQMNCTQSLPVHPDGPPASVLWSVIAVSLIVIALFIISFIYLWISKTKMKSKQITNSHMSTQETDSNVYENYLKV